MTPNEDFQLDGIPVFVHPQGRDESPFARASITFRVGTYDEVLAYAGITRLAHHVIASTIPLELREYVSSRNGGIFTMFTVAAPVERFHDCLRELARAIREPDWELTERMQRLLVADPNPDVGYPSDFMLRDRYGSVGPGTTVVQPMALAAVNQTALEMWVREHFCCENASIVSTESAIEPGCFVINTGQSRGVMLTSPQPLTLPAYFNNGDDGVGFQLLLPAGVAADLTVAVTAELVHRRITQLEQLSPRIAFGSNLLDSSCRAFTGSMPISPENVVPAVKAIRQTLQDIADAHIASDVIDKARGNMQEALREQVRAGEDTFARSHAAIFSAVQPAETTLAALDAITKEDICGVARESLSSLLIYVPPGVEIEEVPLGVFPEPAEVEGIGYRKLGLSVFRLFGNNRSTVVTSNEGITFKSADKTVTILFASCTAMVDNGVSLHLIDRNGSYIKLFPLMYRRGDELAATLRKAIDPTLVVSAAATDDDLEAQRLSMQHLKELSGWRAIVGVVAASYLFVLLLWVVYRVTQFAGESIERFGIVVALIGAIAWLFRPLTRRARMASALRSFAGVIRELGPGLIFTYLIDTYLVLVGWSQLQENPPNYWGFVLLSVAFIPFVFALVTYKRSKAVGRQRFSETFRAIWIGNVAQVLIGAISALIIASVN